MPTLIRLVSVATLGIAAWLGSVLILVLPARDPADIALWAVVAVGAGGLGVLSFVVTDPRMWRRSAVPIALAIGAACLAVVALVLGFGLLLEERSEHPEGYLLAIGLVFASHGALVIVWLGARLVSALNRSTERAAGRRPF